MSTAPATDAASRSYHSDGPYLITSKWILVAAIVVGAVFTILSACGSLNMIMLSSTGCWALAGVGSALLFLGSIGLMVRGCCGRSSEKELHTL